MMKPGTLVNVVPLLHRHRVTLYASNNPRLPDIIGSIGQGSLGIVLYDPSTSVKFDSYVMCLFNDMSCGFVLRRKLRACANMRRCDVQCHGQESPSNVSENVQ